MNKCAPQSLNPSDTTADTHDKIGSDYGAIMVVINSYFPIFSDFYPNTVVAWKTNAPYKSNAL